jgi:hypothetical protein
MFAKSEHLHRGAFASNVFQRVPERLPVGGCDQHRGQALMAAQRDVVEHVAVDVAVVINLRFCEDGEPHVTQSLHPWANDIGATWGDVGEDGGLGLQRDAGFGGRELSGVAQQPAAQRVEAGPVRGGRPAAEDGAEPHVEIGCIPHQQNPARRRGAVGL